MFEEKKDDNGIDQRVAEEVLELPEAAPRDQSSRGLAGSVAGVPKDAGAAAGRGVTLLVAWPVHMAGSLVLGGSAAGTARAASVQTWRGLRGLTQGCQGSCIRSW